MARASSFEEKMNLSGGFKSQSQLATLKRNTLLKNGQPSRPTTAQSIFTKIQPSKAISKLSSSFEGVKTFKRNKNDDSSLQNMLEETTSTL